MLRRLPIAVAAAFLAVAAPAAAQKPEDVSRVESAVVELSKLKRGSEGQVAAHVEHLLDEVPAHHRPAEGLA